jgi:importin-7
MNEKREGGYAGSDSSSEEEDIEEELGYFSPLDTVDPYKTFKVALTSLCLSRSLSWHALILLPTAFQLKNPTAHQAATTSLDVEQKTTLIEVMKKAELPESQA